MFFTSVVSKEHGMFEPTPTIEPRAVAKPQKKLTDKIQCFIPESEKDRWRHATFVAVAVAIALAGTLLAVIWRDVISF